MKAMRERIAVQRYFVRKTLESFCFFAQAFGVRTRPRVAFLAYDLTIAWLGKIEPACSITPSQAL
jgi:hypothetical protein